MRAGSLARCIFAAVVVAGIVFIAATTAGASTLVAAANGWSQYQGDAQHTGVALSAPAAPFRVAWSEPTGIGDDSHFAGIPAPVIAGENAIVVDREDVAALSLTSGAVAWTIHRQLGPSAPAAVAASLDRTTILFTEGGGDLSSSAGGTATPSASASSSASTADRSTLVAVDANTRKVLWRRSLPDVSIGGPTVDGSTVLVGTDDGSVTAIALDSGHQEWTVDLGDSINTPIAASDGISYVSVSGGSGQPPFVVALRESDETQVWSFSVGGAGLSVGAPSVADGVVYVTASDASMRAIDAATGDARWAAKLNTVSGGGSPAVSSDAVVVADIRGQLYRFTPATGDRVWDFAMNVPVYGSPVIAGSTVVVGDSDGDVSAIDLQTGERIWRQNVGDGLPLALALAPETIVVARTGPSAGLVALVTDPSGVLISEQSPTIVKPFEILITWAAAAIPLVLVLLLSGRFLAARLGPVTFGDQVSDESESFEDELT